GWNVEEAVLAAVIGLRPAYDLINVTASTPHIAIKGNVCVHGGVRVLERNLARDDTPGVEAEIQSRKVGPRPEGEDRGKAVALQPAGGRSEKPVAFHVQFISPCTHVGEGIAPLLVGYLTQRRTSRALRL